MKVAVLALLPLLASARPADACSFAPDGVHELDPSHADDAVAPSAPTVVPAIRRWEYPSSCFDIALIDLAVSATDDRTPVERLGYQLRVASGDAPTGLSALGHPLTANDIVPADPGSLSMFFNYRDEEFAFELEVRAVDLNGNIGPASVIFIADAPQQDVADVGGCSTGRASHAVVALLTLISMLFPMRLRR